MGTKIFSPGYNILTQQNGLHRETMMDIGVYQFAEAKKRFFCDSANETAFLLLDGSADFAWGQHKKQVERHSVFNQKPTCLHVPAGCRVSITGSRDTEVLIQKTSNNTHFDPVFYPADSIRDVFLGADNMQGCAKRILRDIFNYQNAPYSNMVLGEDLHLPGRWSSYPPHHHPQPEVYFYRFDKPQGFGVSIVGDNAAVIGHNEISAIPGGLCHPQVAAPGYAMYYAWMIRHLEDNPWTSRVDDPAHTWLHDKNADIWNGPKEE